MGTSRIPRTRTRPGLLFLACLLLGCAVWLAACGEPASSASSATTLETTVTSEAASTPTVTAADVSLFTGLTPVVGSFYLAEVIYTAEATMVGDICQMRDEHWVLRGEMSDPRLNGDTDMIINVDQRADGSADVWGTAVIRDEQGTWECSKWTMAIAKGGLEHFGWSVYEGTGAYVGLTCYSQAHFVEIPGVGKPPAEGVAVTGWIQETK